MQLVAGKLPPGTLSRESLSCCSRLESSLGFVSQGRGFECRAGERNGGLWPWKEAMTITQVAFHSVCLPLPWQQTSVTPWSLAGCSLSTPMSSEVTSSIPSSVKPAFSSLTYFSHSAVFGTMPLSVPCLDPSFCLSWCRSPGLCQAFCLESLTSVDGKRKKKRRRRKKTLS